MRNIQSIRKASGKPGNSGFAAMLDLIGQRIRPIPDRRLQGRRKAGPKAHEESGNALV